MFEVFVNYRHDEGNTAGRLAERLEDEFDVFIDTKLEPGASFEGEILPALDASRVVLAVIGKEWLEPSSLDRLKNEEDWVRRELLRAFGRNDAYVIPLLADVGMPAANLLPEVLLPLRGLKAFQVRYDLWDQDVAAVIKRVYELLAKPARPASSQAGMPADLPYLCDRAEQERDLAALAVDAQATKSLVCVLHGQRWEAHIGFLSRLRQRRALEDVFGAGRVGVDVRQLQWYPSDVQAGRHGEVLRTAIKTEIMGQRRVTDEDLYAFLRSPVRPLVMMLQITADDLEECGGGLLAAFEKAWHQLMAALGAAPTQFLVLWLNVTYDTAPANLTEGLTVAPLKQLNPVRDGDIQTWMYLPQVRQFTERHESALNNLVADQSLWTIPRRIPMQRFVDAVRALIPGP
jgi:hypothetical protein